MMKKTKSVSVAIAESSVGEEPQQQQKRKRGRPKKIVEKIDEINSSAAAAADEAEYEDVLEGESKKAETIEGEQEVNKVELQSEETQLSKLQPSRRSSRAKRKSRPRKSS